MSKEITVVCPYCSTLYTGLYEDGATLDCSISKWDKFMVRLTNGLVSTYILKITEIHKKGYTAIVHSDAVRGLINDCAI